MTAPATEPDRPSDKLIPPLNSPRGGVVTPGVQPGISGQIVLAQYVVVFGDSGGVFIYAGAPALGNPPVYWMGNVTSDPYGNPLDQGIWAGQPGDIQVGIQAAGGLASVFFVPAGAYSADASAGMVQQGGQAIMQLLGARTTDVGQPTSDRVEMFLWDHGAGATAAINAFFIDTNGSSHALWQGNCSGMELFGVLNAQATQPGTGTTPSNPFIPESWHQATLGNSWQAGPGGVGGLFYRLTIENEVLIIGDIIHATATGNSICFQLPSGYRPAQSMNLPAAWNDPVTSNSPSIPWLFINTSGQIQVTGIEVANKEIFFCTRFPLGPI